MRLDRTLVTIRERSFLNLLDLGLLLVRRRPLTLGLAWLAGVLPFALLNRWIFAALERSDSESFPVFALGLWAMEAPWATAPLTVVLGSLMFTGRPPAGRVLRTLAAGLVPMALFQGVLRLPLVGIVVLTPILPAKLPFLNEVILLERGPWSKVYPRASSLTEGAGFVFFGRWLVQVGFGLAFVLAFSAGSGLLIDLLAGETATTWQGPDWGGFDDVRVQAGVWLAIGFFAVARFLMYIDRRVRREGWEIELRLKALGVALEDADRWRRAG